jgi:uncharacterized coiled-coil DUF342 family protein
MEAKLDEWSAQINELEAKARQAKAEKRQEYLELIATLRSNRDAASRKLNEIRDAADDAWEQLKAGAENLWKDVTNTLQQSKDAFFAGLREE